MSDSKDYLHTTDGDSHAISVKAVCSACKGTGLYVGMAERAGAAIQCYRCGGSGCESRTITFEIFRKRQEHEAVRVYKINCGFCIGNAPDGSVKLEDFGGMPYEDWADGEPFPIGSEDRPHACPAWWSQNAEHKNWEYDKCPGVGGQFSSCEHFGTKELCWTEWDKHIALERGD